MCELVPPLTLVAQILGLMTAAETKPKTTVSRQWVYQFWWMFTNCSTEVV